MKTVKMLVGSGDRIGKLVLPFLVIGLGVNLWRPSLFTVGGPSDGLRTVSAIVLAVGVVVWAWSVVLILSKVPRHELITSGPFALVKHPLYTGVGLLVLPAAGFLLDSWLGLLVGVVIYAGSRLFAGEEERTLSEAFGPAWDEYCDRVALPWV